MLNRYTRPCVFTERWRIEVKKMTSFIKRDDAPLADTYLVESIDRVRSDRGCIDENPRPRWSDGTPAHTRFVTHVQQQYNIAAGEFPLVSIRNMAWKSAVKEVLWIYQDQTSELCVLEEKHGIKWWREWESKKWPGTIGQRYGATVKRYQLIDRLLKSIRENPYGRRHIMSLWQENDFAETDGLMPCAFETIWTVRGEYLDMALIQRSSDYLTAGHLNQLQYAALMMMVAQACGYKPGIFTHFIANLHIYDRHIENADRLMERYNDMSFESAQPQLILNPEVKDFYAFTIDDFTTRDWSRFKEPKDNPMKFEVAI